MSPAPRRVSLRASYSGRWPSRMRWASAALSRGRPQARFDPVIDTSHGSPVASASSRGRPHWPPCRHRCQCTAVQPFAAIRRLAFDSLSTTLRGGIRSRSATRRSASAGPHMPGLDPNCHGDADEALRIASGCIPRAHGTEAVDVRSAGGGRSQPGASALSWPIPETGDGLSGPRVHRSLPPGPSGPCSLPRGNAPRNSSPNRTEADR